MIYFTRSNVAGLVLSGLALVAIWSWLIMVGRWIWSVILCSRLLVAGLAVGGLAFGWSRALPLVLFKSCRNILKSGVNDVGICCFRLVLFGCDRCGVVLLISGRGREPSQVRGFYPAIKRGYYHKEVLVMDYITTREIKIGHGVRFLCSGLGETGSIRIVFTDRAGVQLFSHVLEKGTSSLLVTLLHMAENDNSLGDFLAEKGES